MQERGQRSAGKGRGQQGREEVGRKGREEVDRKKGRGWQEKGSGWQTREVAGRGGKMLAGKKEEVGRKKGRGQQEKGKRLA